MKLASMFGLLAGPPALLLLLLAGCGQGGGGRADQGSAAQKPSVAITAADRAEAESLFTTRCAVCHGTAGHGDGPGAAGLNPKPRNYADRQWQKAVKDEEIERAILYGGPAVGKSPQMIANPDLQAKPGVVAALREKVRSFAH
ncbi:cytochrome c [bacterium]|nr:cytochrome c [bacterium]